MRLLACTTLLLILCACAGPGSELSSAADPPPVAELPAPPPTPVGPPAVDRVSISAPSESAALEKTGELLLCDEDACAESRPVQVYIGVAVKKLQHSDYGAASKASAFAVKKDENCGPCWAVLAAAQRALGLPEAAESQRRAEALGVDEPCRCPSPSFRDDRPNRLPAREGSVPR